MNLSIYRICLQGLVLAAIAVGTSSAVSAQGYPNKPITIKVAFPAGGCSPSAPMRQAEGLHGGRISGSS